MTTKPQDNLRNGEPCADGVTCIVSIAAAEEAAAHIDTQAARIAELEMYKKFSDRVILQVACEDEVDANDLLAAMLNGGLVEGGDRYD